VIARKSFLAQADQDVPTMLAYRTHDKNDSLYNTPPAFAIYVAGLVLKWVEAQGGLAGVEAANRQKAGVVYSALDAFPDVYEPTVTKAHDRSLMNITFRLRDPTREADFLAGAKARRMVGLKGHRSVGGFRASTYNACPRESAEALAEYLHAFAMG
jgi:phosphoserine aminotransferase